MLDMIAGAGAAVLVIVGYWTLLACYDWWDHRGARQIARRAKP